MYMKKIFSSLLCGLLIFLTFDDSATAGKMSKQQTDQFSKPFRMLTFDQIARLEYTQRVRYVHELRRIALEIEKAQFMFKDTLFVDNRSNKSDEHARLYAILFGALVDTAEAQSPHTRGANISDRCVYGYNLSAYPKDPSDVHKPFGCEIPSEARCKGSGGAGVRCGYYLSGLSGSEDLGCIPDKVRYKATTLCDEARRHLSGENGKRIIEAIDNAENFFKFNQNGAKIPRADMSSEAAAQILKDLADTAYDDRSYAELIYVLSFYKKSGIPIPLETLGEQYEKIKPDLFKKNLDSLQAGINQVFGDYIGHCERKLSKEEVALLFDEKWKNEAEQKGSAAWEQEKRRIEAVKKLNEVSSSEYRVDNVLQIPECRAIYARRDGIRNELYKIVGSYPEFSDDAPAGEMPVPIAPPEKNIVKSTGCSTNVVADESQLYQGAARCSICLAEQNMAKTADAHSSPAEKDRRKFYTTSTKWTSLVSTMALACGDGVSSGTNLLPETMVEYMHTFGHCSADTYEWEPETSLSAGDKALIEEWSTNNLWFEKDPDKIPDADINKDFRRIYGVSYETATKVFCDPKQFKKGWFTNKIKMRNENYDRPTNSERMALSRAQFTDLLSGKKLKSVRVMPDNYKDDSVADALLKCMRESLKTAEELYSGNKDTCTMFHKVKDVRNNRTQLNRMINEVKSAGPALIADPGHCYVAKQYETDTTKGSLRESLGFVDPKAASSDTDTYVKLSFFGEGNEPQMMAFPQFDQPGDPDDGRNRNPINVSENYLREQYSFTTPGSDICTRIAARPASGKKKSKGNEDTE